MDARTHARTRMWPQGLHVLVHVRVHVQGCSSSGMCGAQRVSRMQAGGVYLQTFIRMARNNNPWMRFLPAAHCAARTRGSACILASCPWPRPAGAFMSSSEMALFQLVGNAKGPGFKEISALAKETRTPLPFFEKSSL